MRNWIYHNNTKGDLVDFSIETSFSSSTSRHYACVLVNKKTGRVRNCYQYSGDHFPDANKITELYEAFGVCIRVMNYWNKRRKTK